MEPSYRFDDFELDVAARELRRNGQVLPLQPKVFDVLALLVQRAGQALGRDDFLDHIWAGRFVTENVLSRCIRQLRLQLGDDAADPSYIRTVRSHGYQFIADVRRAPDEAGPAPLSRIAVLPFRPVLPQAAQPALELGLSETLVNDLSRFESLVVRPLAAVRDAMGVEGPGDLIALGKRLNVDVLLDGSLQADANQLRLNVRALRVQDGSALMAERFDAPMASLFEVQDRLCARVAQGLVEHLAGASERAARRRQTRDLRAYQAYVDGRLKLSLHSVDGIQAALADFERASALDPEFVEALVGISEANDLLATIGNDPGRFHERTRRAAHRALALDPERARAHACLGKVAWQHDWDWAEAEKRLRLATELDPGDADAFIAYSDYQCHVARFDEALENAERAGAINPFSPWIQSLIAQALFLGGKLDEALEQSQQTVDRSPEFGFARFFLARSLFATGHETAAIAEFREAIRRSGRPDLQGALAHALALSGDRAGAEAILGKMTEDLAAGAPIPPIAIAMAHVGLGNDDEAVQFLQQVLHARSWHILLLNVDPAFRQLRARPEGLALLRPLRLPPPSGTTAASR